MEQTISNDNNNTFFKSSSIQNKSNKMNFHSNTNNKKEKEKENEKCNNSQLLNHEKTGSIISTEPILVGGPCTRVDEIANDTSFTSVASNVNLSMYTSHDELHVNSSFSNNTFHKKNNLSNDDSYFFHQNKSIHGQNNLNINNINANPNGNSSINGNVNANNNSFYLKTKKYQY